MDEDRFRIGKIIKEHFNWEQYMDFINPDKMEILSVIDSPEKLNLHKNAILKIAGSKYILTPQIEYIMEGMIYYFNGNSEKAKEYGMDTSKGIALIGQPGVGKTILFELMHRYLQKVYQKNCPNNFWTSSTDKLIETMLLDNAHNSQAYINDKPDGYSAQLKKPGHLLLNEFAVRYNIRRWGTDVNDLIDTILMRRYEVFQQYRKVTLVTTNAGTNQLEEVFHDRLISRFIEMFNMIKLEGKSFRV